MSERDMQTLLAIVERALGREWVDLADWLRGLPENDLQAIEQRIRTGQTADLIAQIEDAARTFAAASHAQYERAGRAAAAWLDDQPKLSDRVIRFDAVNEQAVTAARRNELALVRGFVTEQRETMRTVLVDGQRTGRNPRDIARDVRDSVTLTPHQAQHVINYRRALETGDFDNAMGRELHDDRYNRTLTRVARDGGSLSPEQIDGMVDRYRRNYVAYRAETIARTESARNVHDGIAETFRQAIQRGDIEADELVKEWIPGPVTRHADDVPGRSGGRGRAHGELPLYGRDHAALIKSTRP